MDKETLSSYGWIVIITLVLAVMIALASPFGEFVGDGVVTVVNGFINTNSKTIDEGNIDKTSEKWESKFSTFDKQGSINNGGSETTPEEETLAPGLYDAQNNITYSWEQLTNSEKLPIEKTDMMGNPNGTTSALIFNGGTITTEIDMMTGEPYSSNILSGHLVIDSSVEKISGQCFMSCTNLKSVFIPKSVVSIEGAAFAYCSNLTEIYYEGTMAEWNNINLELSFPEWNIYCPAVICCSDGNITCTTCNGEGTIQQETTCPKCNGGYTITCTSCLGSIGIPCQHKCITCNGGVSPSDWIGCSVCNATGELQGVGQCPPCSGTGMVLGCTACNGYGTYNRENCMICNGSGFESICNKCSGTGFIVCTECNATGKVHGSIDCPDCN